MKPAIFLTRILFILIFCSALFQLFSVKAADPLTSTFDYNSTENSFSFNVSPKTEGSVALYYKKGNNEIDAVFGSEGKSLAGETCSGGTCVKADVKYGIAKIYLPTEKWLKVIHFKKEKSSLQVLKEETFPDIDPNEKKVANTLGAPPENPLLQLTSENESWLKEPVEFPPTETPTLTPTQTPTQTPMPTEEMRVSALTGTLTPSPTPAQPIVPPSCSNGPNWVNQTIAVTQGTQLDGLPVPMYRSNTSYAYAAPDAVYYTLGKNGTVTYKFAGEVQNIPGADLDIYEETLGRMTYPIESAQVQVSDDGVTWFTLPQQATSRANSIGVSDLDFGVTGLSKINYIRLNDTYNVSNLNPESDGFDINAIQGRNVTCATPSVTPTLTPTRTPTPSSTTPTLTPSPTPANPILGAACTAGTGVVSETVSVNQTTQLDGLPVPAYRSNTSYAYGLPDLVYFTMGINGTVTYKFPGTVTNVPGVDFNMYEETLGRVTYPEERAKVEISQDGVIWLTLPTLASSRSPLGVTGFDINSTGLANFSYIRVTDVFNPANLNLESDGYDINAIVAVQQECPIVTPTPTVTPTPSITGPAGALLIQKSNNRVGQTIVPGSDVVYTIKVMAQEGGLDDVQVIDLPPNGFDYQGGSWTAKSDTRGDLKTGGTTTEPTYHSPGTWKLGDMQEGETVTLTYKAHINTDVEGGVHTDLAWAHSNNATVLSEGTSSSFVNDEFVGTEVAIARNIQTAASIDVKKTENKTSNGDVLGAATKRLPRTGASNIWVTLATIILVSGIGTLSLGLFLLNKKVKVKLLFRYFVQFLAVVGLLTVMASAVNAATTTIRLSLPQDRNNSNFKIRFVTLDSDNRQITVKCYKKGPSDPDFAQFGSDIVLAPGGNSGTCNVDSSVVGTNGASYQFLASAQAAGGSAVYSDVVGTSFSNQSPGTPVNYSKQQSGCTNKITFKTANDGGKTKKVEIYRSENTSFTADGGTKVGEVSANSNEDKSFENTGDCGKTYYYVIRAFDEFGNGSGLTGDSQVSVTTTNTSTTTNGTAGGGGTTGGGAIPVAPGQGNVGAANQAAGQVQGVNERTTPGATDEAVLGATNSADTKAPEQKGEEKFDWKTIFMWVLIGLTIVGIGYAFISKRK